MPSQVFNNVLILERLGKVRKLYSDDQINSNTIEAINGVANMESHSLIGNITSFAMARIDYLEKHVVK